MSDERREREEKTKRASLETAASNLLEEARMLLPGTQTLFGFQLIVVFNGAFGRLSTVEQYLHLVAMLLTAGAIALLMAPAAYHRQAEPEHLSRQFVRMSSRLLTAGTVPLAIAIAIEVYLVASLVTRPDWLSVAAALAVLLVFTLLWYVLPARRRSRVAPREGPPSH
jgi:cobalamin synthase